jgi:hypothetical protein
VPGIFAGGDMVPAERTVTVAIGHGKHAAASIDAWLRASHELLTIADRPVLVIPVGALTSSGPNGPAPGAGRTGGTRR